MQTSPGRFRPWRAWRENRNGLHAQTLRANFRNFNACA
jgi:hypothetical protein